MNLLYVWPVRDFGCSLLQCSPFLMPPPPYLDLCPHICPRISTCAPIYAHPLSRLIPPPPIPTYAPIYPPPSPPITTYAPPYMPPPLSRLRVSVSVCPQIPTPHRRTTARKVESALGCLPVHYFIPLLPYFSLL